MNIAGLVLFLITLIIVICLIILYPKIFHQHMQKYSTFLIMAVISLIYIFFGRFLWIFIDLINDPTNKTNISNFLSLDMCPFMAFWMPIMMIFDRKRRYITIIAPFAFFGGLISIFGTSFNNFENGVNSASLTWSYIFVGHSIDHLFFMMHFILIINATFIMLSTKYEWRRMTIGSSIWMAFFVIYAVIFAYSIGIDVHAFGVVPGDWTPGSGQFGAVSEIAHLGYPYSMILGYILFTSLVAIIAIAFYYIKKVKWFKDLTYIYEVN